MSINLRLAALEFFPREQKGVFDFCADSIADSTLNFHQVNKEFVGIVVE